MYSGFPQDQDSSGIPRTEAPVAVRIASEIWALEKHLVRISVVFFFSDFLFFVSLNLFLNSLFIKVQYFSKGSQQAVKNGCNLG